MPTGEMPSFVRRGPHPIPIAADESLQSPALRKQLIEARLAFGVLKPTVLGGTLACLDLAAVLRAHGGRAIVTHTFEGPVGMAAAAALASALPGDPIAAGLDRHPALAIWPKVPTPSGVGLGVPRLRL